MIMTIEELRQYIETSEKDAMLVAKLQALELLIRKYTNNNFQHRAFRSQADIVGGLFICDESSMFKKGDTVQITESQFNSGLFTVKEAEGVTFRVNEDTTDEKYVLVTKVEYPMDVKMGVVNMLKWDIDNRAKVGIQSETISRHSVTYFDLTGDNAAMGYPKSLLGFLKPYMRARF